MSDNTQDELRAELAEIVDETRRHLLWMQESGQRVVRREGGPPSVETRAAPSFSRPSTAPQGSESSNRTRPAFMETRQPAPVKSPPPPPAPVERAAPPAPPRVANPLTPTPAPAPTRTPTPQPAPVAASGPSLLPKTQRPAVAEAGAPDSMTALKIIRKEIGDCTRCKLSRTRNTIVYGQGDPNAEIVFLGEGPGADEDLSGLAFVGKAGQLLTKMIEAMGYTRDEVYICNIVKCRPPDNRKPEPDEVEACRPFVERQILAIKPKVIVALGATAVQSLLRTNEGITRLRNNWKEWEGIPVMPTFHPSYLLRAPDEKKKAWDDLKLVMARVGRQPKKPI